MLLLAATLAHADPVALRAPSATHTLAVANTSVSYAMWDRDRRWGVAFHVDDLGRGATGAWVGVRTEWRAPSGFGVDVHAAAGLLLLRGIDLGLGVTPAAAVGWRRPRFDATLGLVAPLAFKFTHGPALSVPILLEPWVGVHLGAFTVGGGGAAGPVLSAGELFAVDLRWMLSVGWTPGGAK